MEEKEILDNNPYEEHMEIIKELVSTLSAFIEEHNELKDLNFGLFYQEGRIGFMDLDAFAAATKVTTDEGTEVSLTELKQDIDKEEE